MTVATVTGRTEKRSEQLHTRYPNFFTDQSAFSDTFLDSCVEIHKSLDKYVQYHVLS